MTGLQTGQSINVPINQKLDVWAEIQRLETDRARLVVDWGNGNSDFSGCGACRVENTYTRAGTYTLTARVLDLNDTTGTPVASATVTINVVEEEPGCSGAAVSADFENFAFGAVTPFSVSGATFTGSPGSRIDNFTGFEPYLTGNFMYVKRPSVVITFANNRNDFRAGLATSAGVTLSYQARDVDGTVVKSGSASLVPTVSGVGAFVSFGGVVFRSVTISISPVTSTDFGIDNVTASCK